MNKRQAKTIALGLAIQVLSETSVAEEIRDRQLQYLSEDRLKIVEEWGV